jgi:hypothetical protein
LICDNLLISPKLDPVPLLRNGSWATGRNTKSNGIEKFGHDEAPYQKVAEKEALLNILQAEIQKVRAEMTRTHRLYIDGQITSQDVGQFYKPAEERLNQLLAELPKLETEVAHLKVTDLSVEEVTSEAERPYTQRPKLPLETKRSILESIVERITIGDGEIDLTLSYFPSSEDACKNNSL